MEACSFACGEVLLALVLILWHPPELSTECVKTDYLGSVPEASDLGGLWRGYPLEYLMSGLKDIVTLC